MRDLRAVSDVKEKVSTVDDIRDLEAETAHRINLLVARTKTWRHGSMQSATATEAGVEVAAS